MKLYHKDIKKIVKYAKIRIEKEIIAALERNSNEVPLGGSIEVTYTLSFDIGYKRRLHIG